MGGNICSSKPLTISPVTGQETFEAAMGTSHPLGNPWVCMADMPSGLQTRLLRGGLSGKIKVEPPGGQ